MSDGPRTFTSWGRSRRSVSRAWHVSDADAARARLREAGPRGVIARGYARSYGDVCLNDGGDVLDVTSLGGIRSLDAERGTLVVGAGASYADILRTCRAAGWQLPVCPGTAFVSMGGALANDVHGKNQHVSGSFGDHVEWLDLLLPNGEERRVSPTEDPDLFAATIGGIGLTGLILAMQIRLMPIASNAMELEEARVPDLDAFLERLRESMDTHPYAVGWIDAMTQGRHLGRGLLELARPATVSVSDPSAFAVTVPFSFPSWALNKLSVSAFNASYYRRVPSGGRARRIHVEKFLFPLDAIHRWNLMYGTRGFYQFQAVVPFDEGRVAIRELLETVVRSRGASFLAVLKSMNAHGRGLISFPMPGFSLAIDLPRRADTHRLVERLGDIALHYGGRSYLAKDACLTPAQYRAMYPGAAQFREVLERVDPRGVMQSDMSRRLGISRS